MVYMKFIGWPCIPGTTDNKTHKVIWVQNKASPSKRPQSWHVREHLSVIWKCTNGFGTVPNIRYCSRLCLVCVSCKPRSYYSQKSSRKWLPVPPVILFYMYVSHGWHSPVTSWRLHKEKARHYTLTTVYFGAANVKVLQPSVKARPG